MKKEKGISLIFLVLIIILIVAIGAIAVVLVMNNNKSSTNEDKDIISVPNNSNNNINTNGNLTKEMVINYKTAPASDFEYKEDENGNIVITGYIGTDTIVSIPNNIEGKSVVSIESGAFVNDDEIKALKIPDTLKTIGDKAFTNCESLEIFIPGKSLEIIEGYAFLNCNLKSVELNDGLKTLKGLCFGGNENLTEIYIPATVTTIEYPFNRNEKTLTIIGEKGTEAERYFDINEEDYNLAFKLKDGTDNNHQLPVLDANISDGDITVDFLKGASATDSSLFVCVEEDDGLSIVKFKGNNKVIVIPDEINGKKVVSIDDEVFKDNQTLRAVRLGNNVKEIGSSIFENCSNMSIFISGTSLKRINASAFRDCKSLKNVELNEGIEFLNSGCFANTGLEEIYIPDSVEVMDNPFYGYNEKTLTIIGSKNSAASTYVYVKLSNSNQKIIFKEK